MKQYILLILGMLLALSAKTQLSLFTEVAVSPFASKNDAQLTKNLTAGVSYKLINQLKIRTGITALDFRKACSQSGYLEIFILGDVIQSDFSALNHTFDLHSASWFVGLEKDFKRFKVAVDYHLARGKMQNSFIKVDESYLVSIDPKVLYFESSYASVNYSKIHLKLAYQLIKMSKGSVFVFARYANDFIKKEGALLVDYYDPELESYISTIPNTTMYPIMDFLEGGNLYYNNEALFFGIEVNYTIAKERNK